MSNLIVFGKRLREIREENLMTIRELADAIGLSEATLSRYENGLIEPKRTTVSMLAKMFGVNPAWLIGYEGAPKYLESGPTEKYECIPVPIIGKIAAGLPILAQENYEGYALAPYDRRVDFCLRVKGDSMINARIFDGDLVFIRSQPDVENGEIAAVVIDDEATLKRVYKSNGTLILRAENPKYLDIVFTGKDCKNVRIIGKAVFFISEVR